MSRNICHQIHIFDLLVQVRDCLKHDNDTSGCQLVKVLARTALEIRGSYEFWLGFLARNQQCKNCITIIAMKDEVELQLGGSINWSLPATALNSRLLQETSSAYCAFFEAGKESGWFEIDYYELRGIEDFQYPIEPVDLQPEGFEGEVMNELMRRSDQSQNQLR